MAIIIIIIPNASRKERKRLNQGPDPDAAAAALPLPRSRVPGPSCKGVEPRAAYIIYIYIYIYIYIWHSKRTDVAVQDLAAWRRQDAYRGPQTSTSWVDPSGVIYDRATPPETWRAAASSAWAACRCSLRAWRA